MCVYVCMCVPARKYVCIQVTCVSLVTVSVPRFTFPKQPVRSWEKLLGEWSLGDDGGEMVSMLIYLVKIHSPYCAKSNLKGILIYVNM